MMSPKQPSRATGPPQGSRPPAGRSDAPSRPPQGSRSSSSRTHTPSTPPRQRDSGASRPRPPGGSRSSSGRPRPPANRRGGSGRPAPRRGPGFNKPTSKAEFIKEDHVRIIPLGGLEEVGRNMMLIEYKNNILIIDMGLQFPDDDMPGIDYIIPNVSYLTEHKEKKVVGVIITHGHMDHIGAIPHLMSKIGNPPIYTAALSRGMILKRQEDHKGSPKPNIQLIKKDDKITLSPFKVEFFHVNHNIPDSLGVVIHTPVGTLVHTGDFKFDHTPTGDEPADLARIAEVGSGGVHVLMSDSTNADEPGHTISEREVQKNLDKVIRDAPGRVVAATFSSLVTRIRQLVEIAEKYDRHVAFDGFSMKTVFALSNELGYIKTKRGTVIDVRDINKYPNNKVMLISTGAQGEGNAVLMRIANKEHKHFSAQQGDTFIFSSSVVPGNERNVQSLKDGLTRQGVRIIHSRMMDIHASGHARGEDLRLMMNLIRPKQLIPIHGHHFMLRAHGEIGESMGLKPENIGILSNGQVAILTKNGTFKKTTEYVPTSYVFVDGLGVGDVGEVVLRDRQEMAKDGMFVIIATISRRTGKIVGSPDIISRGFVYLRESKDLLTEVRKQTKEIVERTNTPGEKANWSYVKGKLRDQLGEFLFKKTKRRPMVIPVIIEV